MLKVRAGDRRVGLPANAGSIETFTFAVPWRLLWATQACVLALPAASLALGADLRLVVAEWFSAQVLAILVGGGLAVVARRSRALTLLPEGFRTPVRGHALTPYSQITDVIQDRGELRVVLASNRIVRLRVTDPEHAARALRSRMAPGYRAGL